MNTAIETLTKIRDLALELQGYKYDGSMFKSVANDKQVYAFSRMAQVDRQRIIKIESAARKALAEVKS
jgi:hypothetical protein